MPDKPPKSITRQPDTKATVVPASVRSDGTMRKERKIRPGYIAQEQQEKYVTPAQRRLKQKQSDNKEERAVEKTPLGEEKPIEEKRQKGFAKYVPPHKRNNNNNANDNNKELVERGQEGPKPLKSQSGNNEKDELVEAFDKIKI
ncbi:hypothetical protein GGI25_004656 [Coemansia spiralis]|uniref:WIBG Mago-binding domain-containing protein n=2 Tax=Coemansia TaxID=4863 RepID=A0A9W8G5Q7_9FUNG|nr:hypothetical protein BX070DRAFT_84944 [Coemansia spiralis]KAJ1989612.1 hypothetical protein EDC05_004578 [Coemansia umbellata]KAJ2620579.1 hypothetical protein GGI26_004868 [Coemansia sp. RSA 1358]KAJ2673601.1 hypothetical protein GGI25_004656 [Coemansia spiralis]